MIRILLAEDDKELAESLAERLEMQDYTVVVAVSGESALKHLGAGEFDVIILDWGLPEMSGVEVLQAYRAQSGAAPVIFLTGKGDIDSKETGLNTGADDYMVKPFLAEELDARIRSLLRRPKAILPAQMRFGDVVIESDSRKVIVQDKEVRLTPKEYSVLEFLAKHANRTFSSRQLLDALWSAEVESSEDTVRTCLKTLRRKISADKDECIIQTVHGGYTIRAYPDAPCTP